MCFLEGHVCVQKQLQTNRPWQKYQDTLQEFWRH